LKISKVLYVVGGILVLTILSAILNPILQGILNLFLLITALSPYIVFSIGSILIYRFIVERVWFRRGISPPISIIIKKRPFKVEIILLKKHDFLQKLSFIKLGKIPFLQNYFYFSSLSFCNSAIASFTNSNGTSSRSATSCGEKSPLR